MSTDPTAAVISASPRVLCGGHAGSAPAVGSASTSRDVMGDAADAVPAAHQVLSVSMTATATSAAPVRRLRILAVISCAYFSIDVPRFAPASPPRARPGRYRRSIFMNAASALMANR